MNLIDFVVVKLFNFTVQHSRIAMATEGADRGDTLPPGGSTGLLPPSDAVAGGCPIEDEVLVADGLVARATA